MKIKISEIREKMIQSLVTRNLTIREAELIVEPFIEAELRGKRTHGISKFFVIDEGLSNRGTYEVVRDTFNYSFIDGHKELGSICAQKATDILIEKTKIFGSGFVGIKNAFYFSVLWPYAKIVSNAGNICIIIKSGGPAGVAPLGGIDPIMGINPLCISIPTKNEPIILDMTCAQKPWGEVNLAMVENRDLDDNTFLTKEGTFTIDAKLVEAIIPFGGAKGYGLNFMIEILTGAFLGAKMGLQVNNVYETGTFFLSFSPELFSDRKTFYENIELFIKEIKTSRRFDDTTEIFIPGEKGNKIYKKNLKNGTVDIASEVWDGLCLYAKGVDVKTALKIKL